MIWPLDENRRVTTGSQYNKLIKIKIAELNDKIANHSKHVPEKKLGLIFCLLTRPIYRSIGPIDLNYSSAADPGGGGLWGLKPPPPLQNPGSAPAAS